MFRITKIFILEQSNYQAWTILAYSTYITKAITFKSVYYLQVKLNKCFSGGTNDNPCCGQES